VSQATGVSGVSGWWRGAFAITLALAMGIGTFVIAAVSALSPVIVAELDMSRAQLGSLTTVAFGVAASASIVVGRWVDLVSARRSIAWVFVTGGAAAVVAAGAGSLRWLWLAGALCGCSGAVSNPVTNRLVSSYIPIGRQGFQIGLKQSGVSMTQAAVGFGLPPLAILVGWRMSMLTGAACALLGLLLAWAMFSAAQPVETVELGVRRVPEDGSGLRLAVYAFLLATVTTSVSLHMPLYAFDQLGFTATLSGMTTGVMGAVGILGRILWGRASERYIRPDQLLAVIAVAAFFSVLCILFSQRVSPWLLWVGLVAFGSSAVAANAVVMLAVIRGSASGGTGRASGLVGLGLFLGFMIGPVTFGAVVDATNSYVVGWGGVCAVSLLALGVIKVGAISR